MTETRWQRPVFNYDLIMKYDKPGPRYTSYPTAPNFTEEFGNDQFIRSVQQAQQEHPGDLSLYFHIPFCRKLCYFCGCNVVHTRKNDLAEPYLKYLEMEMDKVVSLISAHRRVVQLHWGGGTPTTLSPDLMKRLSDSIMKRFSFDPEAEVGVEVDPRECSDEHLSVLAESGFNRISLGIQDYSPVVQKAINRLQSEELTRRTFETCRKLGYQSINVDLIYGLPYQTREMYEQTVDSIIDMDPDRIAVFNFAYLPSLIKHQRIIKPETLPSPREKLEILDMVIQKFTDAGYVYVGMDHFARPEDELTLALKDRTLYRNFQGYTTKSGTDLFAFGVTSISMVGRCYCQNEKDLDRYQERIAGEGLAVYRGIMLSDEDILRRDIITRLMCHFTVKYTEIDECYGIEFQEYFEKELRSLKAFEDDGLLIVDDRQILVRPLGRLLVRNIAMTFDAYLREAPHSFSRTV